MEISRTAKWSIYSSRYHFSIFLNDTRSRIIKRRRHIQQKYFSPRYRLKVALPGEAITQFFTSCAATQYKTSTATLPLPQDCEGIRFDAESHQIGVDNHSSYSISKNLEYFTSTITPCNATLIRVNGRIKVSGTGTVHWLIDNDFGVWSKIVLQSTFYVHVSHICPLSPQQWAQCSNDHFPTSEGLWCATYSNKVVLH